LNKDYPVKEKEPEKLKKKLFRLKIKGQT